MCYCPLYIRQLPNITFVGPRALCPDLAREGAREVLSCRTQIFGSEKIGRATVYRCLKREHTCETGQQISPMTTFLCRVATKTLRLAFSLQSTWRQKAPTVSATPPPHAGKSEVLRRHHLPIQKLSRVFAWIISRWARCRPAVVKKNTFDACVSPKSLPVSLPPCANQCYGEWVVENSRVAVVSICLSYSPKRRPAFDLAQTQPFKHTGSIKDT